MLQALVRAHPGAQRERKEPRDDRRSSLSSSDYGFCEPGRVCINWTRLLAAGFPAHNHRAF